MNVLKLIEAANGALKPGVSGYYVLGPYIRDLVAALERQQEIERAWARYVNAAIDERDAGFALDMEAHGAEQWVKDSTAALAAAEQALHDLGVDVDALLSEAK